MHGAWSALTILIKKQNNVKYRKAKFRHDSQKRKEKFIKDHPYHLRTELEFPQVSASKLEAIKKEIRRKARRKSLIDLSINIIASILMILFLLYLILIWPNQT
jgi:sensor c-di-GMP phosphodiesterase-like protein